ncbi:GroES-like protein [Pilatotrama ljubarskyi]|nr:GroES-like protein [Pilatotrama ljubarskyi]
MSSSSAIPLVQKSLLLREESTPYVVGETPVPRPGPKDVLVNILACALNPADYAVAEPPLSRILIKAYPHVGGCDGAGIVVEVGSEVQDRKKGDRVLFQGAMEASRATFQQYAIMTAELTAIVPDEMNLEQAATIPLAFTSVFIGLYNQSPAPENISLRLKPFWEPEGKTAYAGTPAFIVAGASSLGQYAIQLAKLAGHDQIITTASPHNAPLLKSLGATHVLDRSRSNESILAELPTLTGGKPILYAFVAVLQSGTEPLYLGRDALAPGGALLTAAPSPKAIPEDIANPGEGKRVGYACGSPHLPFSRDTGVVMYRQLTNWLEQGVIKPNPVEVLPNGLAGIVEGLARIKAKKVSGMKLVARPDETP